MDQAPVDQSQYVYQLLVHSHEVMRAEVLAQHYTDEGMVFGFLNWVAKTLYSLDAFLLSWPDSNKQMKIQDHTAITTPALRTHRTLRCSDRLAQWLADINSDEPWMVSNTAELSEFSSADIRSIIITKVFTREAVDFQGRLLLAICNRQQPAWEGYTYLSYDKLFCYIAQGVLRLHIGEVYKLARERYRDAQDRYERDQSIASLQAVSIAANDLLALYRKYSARPTSRLLYDCVSTSIARFSVKDIDSGKLRDVLSECERAWRLGTHEQEKEHPDLVRFALARGYFALGIQNESDWDKGKDLMNK